MRWAAPIGLALLASCHQQTFDERFDKAEKEIRDKAASIDSELSQRESEAAMAPTASTSASPIP